MMIMAAPRRMLRQFCRGTIGLAAGPLPVVVLICLGLLGSAQGDVGRTAIECEPATCPHSGGADQISPWARESYGSGYCGHYVGGGTALWRGRCGGEARYVHEGTFGMDYHPCWSRVGLLWSHGRRHQSGHGQYETDRKNNGFPNWFRSR